LFRPCADVLFVFDWHDPHEQNLLGKALRGVESLLPVDFQPNWHESQPDFVSFFH
jgi:hypothetical protein